MSLNEITIEVTQRCPNRCIYCSSLSDITKSEQLDIDTIRAVVDDAVALGTKSVSLSGGEPFLRPDLPEIVGYIHSQGLKIRIYSSSIFYDVDTETYGPLPESILDIIKTKVERLIFNYEAIDASLYAKIMNAPASHLAMLDRSIELAIEKGIVVEAHLVPMHCNFRQIPDVLEKLYAMGVVNVSLLRLVPQGRVLDNRELVLLNETEENELKSILAVCRERYSGKIRLGLPFSSRSAACGTGTVKLTVRYDGVVFPCEAFKDGLMELEPGVVPENVREKRLKDIYECSAYLRNVREGLQAYSACDGSEHCYGQYCRMITN